MSSSGRTVVLFFSFGESGEGLGRALSDSTSRKALSLDGAIKMRIYLLEMLFGWARRPTKAKAEMLDLRRRHRLPMCSYHFGEVLREGIDLLLEEEKGSTDGTQLSFINDKGELLHRVESAFQLVRSGYG
jgi:hypothetical protein